MDIPVKHVFEVLREEGVHELYHANSVATACQFLRSRSLLSRGAVERLGMFQTPQQSDYIDKKRGIWFDVFTDSVDIHEQGSRANVYGPVLFVVDIELIRKTYTGRVSVTKLNPTKWNGKSDRKRWFQDRVDLEEHFVVTTFDHMIVFRHSGGALPFKSYLKKIILDDPDKQTEDDVDIYSMAVGALRLAMAESGLNVEIERRRCHNGCLCRYYWGNNDERLFQMFDPKI